MDKENKQTEQLLEQWAAQIQPPELQAQFCSVKKRKVWFRKKWFYVVGASILACAVALSIWLPSLRQQVPPTGEPPITYYWSTLHEQTADAETINNYCENVPYAVCPKNKEDFIYLVFLENNSQEIFGVKTVFSFITDDQYYFCSLTILNNKVADAKKDYQNLDKNMTWNENVVQYTYIGVISSLHCYKAAFEKNGYVYLIDYSSIEEDFESGLATIFQ